MKNLLINNQIFEDNNFKLYLYINFGLIFLSVLCSSIFGVKSLIILPILIMLYLISKSQMNLLFLYFCFIPFVVLLSLTAANAACYLFASIFILAWLAKELLNGFRGFVVSKPLLILMLTFLFLSAISTLHDGITQGEIFTMVRVVILFSFVIVFYNLFCPKDIFKLIIAMTIPLLINSIFMIKMFLSIKSVMGFFSLYRMKVGGLFYGANAAGFQALLVTPFWISVFFWQRNRIVRISSFIISILLSISIILTNARASIVGILVALFFLFFWKKKLKYYFGAIALTLIIVFSSTVIKGAISVAGRFDRGTTSREVIWANTIDIIKKNIYFGVGLGSFSKYYAPYLSSVHEKGLVVRMSHAHNFVLSKTAELGILGLVWVIAFYCMPIIYGYRLLKKTKGVKDKIVIYGIMAIFYGVYAQSIFEAGGMLQEARFMGDVSFWIFFAVILKANSSHLDKKGNIF